MLTINKRVCFLIDQKSHCGKLPQWLSLASWSEIKEPKEKGHDTQTLIAPDEATIHRNST